MEHNDSCFILPCFNCTKRPPQTTLDWTGRIQGQSWAKQQVTFSFAHAQRLLPGLTRGRPLALWPEQLEQLPPQAEPSDWWTLPEPLSGLYLMETWGPPGLWSVIDVGTLSCCLSSSLIEELLSPVSCKPSLLLFSHTLDTLSNNLSCLHSLLPLFSSDVIALHSSAPSSPLLPSSSPFHLLLFHLHTLIFNFCDWPSFLFSLAHISASPVLFFSTCSPQITMQSLFHLKSFCYSYCTVQRWLVAPMLSCASRKCFSATPDFLSEWINQVSFQKLKVAKMISLSSCKAALRCGSCFL